MGLWAWMLHPAMLAAGAAAMAVPIIIHLLNRRRYKIVAWAAMDFLLEADKKNRRRVQLENFILLALRCLAMLLLGLLLARPLLPSAISQLLSQRQQVERIVVLDDSLSQEVLRDGVPAIDFAKEQLKQWLTDLVNSDETDDWLTLYVTSQTDQPLLANEPVSTATLASLMDVIDRIQITDQMADYTASLQELGRYLQGQRENVTRVVYIYSDLRQHDWLASAAQAVDLAPHRQLQTLGKDLAQGFIVDVGSDADQNLTLETFRAEDITVANRVIRLTTQVTNHGSQSVTDVRVLFQVDDAPPVYETIPALAAGATETVTFRTLFQPQVDDRTVLRNSSEPWRAAWRNYRIRAEIDRTTMTGSTLALDQMISDNSRYLAARIADHIPVLLVDGDPAAVPERSETFFLKFLDVFGTGLRTRSITVGELESIGLSDYRVIFLCNVDSISPEREKAIEQWVSDGGALVFMPGNLVRATVFNETFYRDGQGISPIELESISGDPTMASWVNFEVSPQPHPALATMVASDLSGLTSIDVFSWWTARISEKMDEGEVAVPLRLNDENRSPAMVDRRWGNGRVIAFAIPGDADWTYWPALPSFVPVMLDLIDHLVGNVTELTQIPLGMPLSYPVDLSHYQNRVSLRDPRNERIEVIARPPADIPEGEEVIVQQAQFEPLESRGFYDLGLQRTDGQTESVLFSVNIPPAEGKLQRLRVNTLESDFWGEKFKLISADDLQKQAAVGGATEFWPQVIWVILLVLISESCLAWWFGYRR